MSKVERKDAKYVYAGSRHEAAIFLSANVIIDPIPAEGSNYETTELNENVEHK